MITLYGIALALAAAAGVLLLTRTARAARIDAVTLALIVLPCAFVGARLLYCLVRFRFVFMEMGPMFALTTWTGGFMLWGAVLGGLLGARLYAGRARKPLSAVLDSLACPALLTIALARAAEFFVIDEGRGTYVFTESLCRFPIAVCNEYGEWQLAIFVWEAAAALAILALTATRKSPIQGERARFAALLYAACQVIFESLRMDSTPRFGFVRVSQVIAAIVVLVCVLWKHRHAGAKRLLIAAAIVLAMIGVAGALEWVIDKTPLPLPICYAVMALAMGICVGLGLRRDSARS